MPQSKAAMASRNPIRIPPQQSDGVSVASRPKHLSGLIPDVVDEAVFFFLQAIDEGLLPIKYVGKSGSEVDLAKEGLGELSGWYAGNGGWRDMFSGERRNLD